MDRHLHLVLASMQRMLAGPGIGDCAGSSGLGGRRCFPGHGAFCRGSELHWGLKSQGPAPGPVQAFIPSTISVITCSLTCALLCSFEHHRVTKQISTSGSLDRKDRTLGILGSICCRFPLAPSRDSGLFCHSDRDIEADWRLLRAKTCVLRGTLYFLSAFSPTSINPVLRTGLSGGL